MIPATWLRHHPLHGVDSVRHQILLMDMHRQCGSCFATGHNHRKVIGWTPFVQVSTTQAFSCPETVHQRPCNNNGPRDTPKLCLNPEGSRPPPNKWSLAPRRVHAPNGSLSVSAISVVLTVVTSWHTHAQNSTFPVLHRHREQQWLQAASYALHKWHRHVDPEKINRLLMDPTSEIKTALLISTAIRNESAPIQLAQCRLLAMAISNAKILIYFFIIRRSDFIKQHSETVMVWNYQNANCSIRKNFTVSFIITFGRLSFPMRVEQLSNLLDSGVSIEWACYSSWWH